MNINPKNLTVGHVVYRCYADNGVLLYVGATYDLKKRLAQHRDDLGHSGWVWTTVRITVEHFPDRRTAMAREALVIQDERPTFNVSGTGAQSPRVRVMQDVTDHVPAYVPRHAAAA